MTLSIEDAFKAVAEVVLSYGVENLGKPPPLPEKSMSVTRRIVVPVYEVPLLMTLDNLMSPLALYSVVSLLVRALTLFCFTE